MLCLLEINTSVNALGLEGPKGLQGAMEDPGDPGAASSRVSRSSGSTEGVQDQLVSWDLVFCTKDHARSDLVGN